MSRKVFVGFIALGLSVAGSLYAATRYGQSRQEIRPGYGVVEGVVLDLEGKPVAEAKVTVMSHNGPSVGRLPETLTNSEGRFIVRNVRSGIASMHASKEADGYPSTIFAAFAVGRVVPTVHVTEQQVTSGVVIRLGPKAGRLLGRILDAGTGRPVAGVQVTIYNDEPDEAHHAFGLSVAPDLGDGRFEILVPPVPFKVKATAVGYEKWDTAGVEQQRVGVMRVEAGASQELTIPLRRKPSP